ncbi:MAG: biotin/lipoyl-containing protein [Candidatus Cloacimonadia bacterium]
MKKYKMMINGEKYEAKILSYKGYEAKVNVNGIDYFIEIEKDEGSPTQQVIQTSKACVTQEKISSIKSGNSGKVMAPIPGIVIDVYKKVGDRVETGDVILSLEAMKMESEMTASASGVIKSIEVNKGDSVLEGDLLATITTDKVAEQPKQKKVAPTPQTVRPQATPPSKPRVIAGDGSVRAPIPGIVLDVRVKEGQEIGADDIVIILEAMKMESEIRAGVSGKVLSIDVSKGQTVNEGDILVKVGAK